MSHPRYKVEIQVLNPEPPHLRPHPSFHYELPLRQFPSVSARHFLGHLPFSKRDTCGLSPSSLIIGRHLIRVPFLHHTAFASCSVRHSQPSSRPSISASLGPPHPSCQPWRFPSLLPFWPTAMSHPIKAPPCRHSYNLLFKVSALSSLPIVKALCPLAAILSQAYL